MFQEKMVTSLSSVYPKKSKRHHRFGVTFIHVLDVVWCHPHTSFTVCVFIPQQPRARALAALHLSLPTGSAFD